MDNFDRIDMLKSFYTRKRHIFYYFPRLVNQIVVISVILVIRVERERNIKTMINISAK